MPLVRYSQYFSYPGGGFAADVPMTVRLTGGNQLTNLFDDKAGTTPLPNPLNTNFEGLLTFFAAPGDYMVWFAGVDWPLPVDDAEADAAWPGLFVHEQVSPSSVWTVDHWFGVQPAVTVLAAGQAVEADVTHPTVNQTVITFGAPTGGVAHLRR